MIKIEESNILNGIRVYHTYSHWKLIRKPNFLERLFGITWEMKVQRQIKKIEERNKVIRKFE